MLMVTVVGCGSHAPVPDIAQPGGKYSSLRRDLSSQVSVQDLSRLVQGNSQFAMELFQQLRSAEENVFLAPISISVVLAMTYAGARGLTEQQMASVLHFDLGQDRLHPAMDRLTLDLDEEAAQARSDDEEFDFNMANSLWASPRTEVNPDYLDILARSCGSGVYEVDFRDASTAADRINSWIEEQTRDRIKDRLSPQLLQSARFVLVNAIYLMASWQHPFDKRQTEARPFYRFGGSQKDVPTMRMTTNLPYVNADGMQVVEFPYLGREFSMVVVMPAEGRFDEQVNALDADSLRSLLGRLRSTYVVVTLPRFHVESKIFLADVLQSMGMRAPFAGDADFSGMTQAPIAIQEVIHQTFLDVDEEHSEAAGATAVIMAADGGMGGGPSPEPLVVHIDHPFLFFIKDRQTSSILFFGQIVCP